MVANHSGAIAFDALMTALAVHDEHPEHRHLRLLGADLVFQTAFLSWVARRGGATLACNSDAERLLSAGELVGVFPEGSRASASRSVSGTSCSASAGADSSPPR